jgi:hypothetical protein
MNQPSTLTELYDFLENQTVEERYSNVITDAIRKVRDNHYESGDEQLMIKAQLEMDFMSFEISENELGFLFAGTTKEGKPYKYPSLDAFTDETYNYLIQRQQEAQNILIKSQYSHILWLSPMKNKHHAHTAVDCYLELIPIRESQDRENPQSSFGLEVLEIIQNVFPLSLSAKYKQEEVKKEVLRVLHEYSFESTSSNVIRLRLVELMLKHKAIFKNEDFDGVIDLFCKILIPITASSKHLAIDTLELMCLVEKKLNNDPSQWIRRIAELWEQMSHEREDDVNMISTEFCKNAIKYYKKVRDTEKVKELNKRFDHLKKNINLPSYKTEVDLTKRIKEFKRVANLMSKLPSPQIIHRLIYDKQFLPTEDHLREKAKKRIKSDPLSAMGNTMLYDGNGNVMQHFSDSDEQEYYAILRIFSEEMHLFFHHFIREVIIASVRNEKLTTEDVLLYLKDHSWMGKDIKREGDDYGYRWIELIAPALNEYFNGLHFYFRNPINYLNLILCIDSLTLKIEGMLRDICEFNGVETFELRTDKKGRNISQEKDIHRLLYEEEIKKLIDKDDLLFFRFLLVEKAGYNLRHKVAHSLMDISDYNLHYMNLLVLAVLKFAKYDFLNPNGK